MSAPMEVESPTINKSAAKKPLFEIKKWNPVAIWQWGKFLRNLDSIVDSCAICRNHIMDMCIECQSSAKTLSNQDECTVAWGLCNHAFHHHCINRWLSTRNVCPLDNKPWELHKIGR